MIFQSLYSQCSDWKIIALFLKSAPFAAFLHNIIFFTKMIMMNFRFFSTSWKQYRSFFFSRVICLSIGSAISRQPKEFDDAYEKIKVTCHENILMSFFKPWSKILHKAAKGWRRSKMKAKWRIVTFLLSHCTVCPFPLFPPLFSQLLHQLLTWLKKMKKSLKFCWFWLKTSG